jgi:hypothetical protein
MADGEIIIDTHINTDNIEKDANKLLNKTKKIADEVAESTSKMFNKIDTNKFSNATSKASYEMMRLNMRANSVAEGIDNLSGKMAALSLDPFLTENQKKYYNNFFKNLKLEEKRLDIAKELHEETGYMSKSEISSIVNEQKAIDKLENSIKRVVTNSQKLGSISPINKSNFEGISPELAKIDEKIIRIKNNMIGIGDELRKNVTSFSGEELKKLVSYYDTLQNRLNQLNIQRNIAVTTPEDTSNIDQQANSLKKVDSQVQKINTSAKQTSNSFLKVARIIGDTLVNNSRRAASSMTSIFQKAVSGIKGMFSSMGSFLGRIFRRAGWIILGQIIRKLIADVKQSFQDLKTFGGPFAESAQKITDAYKRAGNAIAAAFAPILIALTPIIVNISNAIVNLMNKLTLFTTALFTNATTATIADINFNGYSRSVQKAAKNTRKSTKAAKEQYKALAKFDKLDVLKRDTQPKMETPDTGEQLPQALNMFKKVAIPRGVMDFKNKLIKALDEIGRKFKIVANEFSRGFNVGFKETNLDEIGNKLQHIGNLFKEIFTDEQVVNKFNETILNLAFNLGKIIGAMSSVGVSLAKMLIGGFEKFLDENKNRIKQSIIRNLDTTIEFNNLLGSVAEFIADVATVFGGDTAQTIFGDFLSIAYTLFDTTFSNIYKLVVKVAENIAKPFLGNTEEIKQAVSGSLKAIQGITTGAKKALQGAGDAITHIVNKSISPALDNLGEIFKKVFGGIIKGWNTNMKPVLEEMGKKMSSTGQKIGDAFRKIAKPINALFDVLQNVYNKIKPFLDKYFYPLFEHFFENLAQKARLAFTIIESVIGSAADIIGKFAEFLEKIINTIGDIINGDWNKVWNDAIDIFKYFARVVLSILKSLPDLFINVLNTIIDSLNAAGSSAGVPRIPSIPKIHENFGIPGLATGTIVSPNRRFLAMLGDNTSEPEVVSPISTMKRAFAEAMNETNIGGTTGDITLQIDGRTFARLINPYMSSEQNRVGISMVQGVY